MMSFGLLHIILVIFYWCKIIVMVEDNSFTTFMFTVVLAIVAERATFIGLFGSEYFKFRGLFGELAYSLRKAKRTRKSSRAPKSEYISNTPNLLSNDAEKNAKIIENFLYADTLDS